MEYETNTHTHENMLEPNILRNFYLYDAGQWLAMVRVERGSEWRKKSFSHSKMKWFGIHIYLSFILKKLLVIYIYMDEMNLWGWESARAIIQCTVRQYIHILSLTNCCFSNCSASQMCIAVVVKDFETFSSLI